MNLIRNPAPEVGNSYLNPEHSWFSVIVPEATVNLVCDPSFEYSGSATPWTVSLGAISHTRCYRGGTSFKMDAAAGDYVTSLPINIYNGYTYTVSAYLYHEAGTGFGVLALIGSIIKLKYTTVYNQWERVTYTFTATANGTVQIRFAKTDGTDIVYVDCVQFEQKDHATTYCDGDEPDCEWNGWPNYASSRRDAYTRKGGKIVSFDDLDFQATGVMGLGLAPLTEVVANNAIVGGAHHVDSIPKARMFVLSGIVEGHGYAELAHHIERLMTTLSPTAYKRQPLHLLAQPFCGNTELGDVVEMEAVLTDGIDGKITQPHQQRMALNFSLPTPNGIGQGLIDASADLNYSTQSDTTQSRTLAYRHPDLGQWMNLGNFGLPASLTKVSAMAWGMSRTTGHLLLYVGGPDWVSAGLHTYNLMAYDFVTGAWIDIGGPDNGAVNCLVCDSDNNLYVGGAFTQILTTMGAHGSSPYLAKWDGVNWSWMGDLDDEVLCICGMPRFGLFVGGKFDQINGVSYKNIARWDGAAWNTLGTDPITYGANGWVRALATDARYLYVGGDFTLLVTAAASAVGRYDPQIDDANAMGIGFDSGITSINPSTLALAVGLDGAVYAGGDIQNTDGVYCVGAWDGTVWKNIGLSLDPAYMPASYDGYPTSLAVDPSDGALIIGGCNIYQFAYHNFIRYHNGVLSWLDITHADPTECHPNSILFLPNGGLVVGDQYDGITSYSWSQSVAVTNEGDTDAYPTIVFVPLDIATEWWMVKNWTTGDTVYLNLHELAQYDHISLKCGTQPTLTSMAYGSMISFVQDDSDLAQLRLIPGVNYIVIDGMHTAGFTGTTATPDIYMYWRRRYLALEGAWH